MVNNNFTFYLLGPELFLGTALMILVLVASYMTSVARHSDEQTVGIIGKNTLLVLLSTLGLVVNTLDMTFLVIEDSLVTSFFVFDGLFQITLLTQWAKIFVFASLIVAVVYSENLAPVYGISSSEFYLYMLSLGLGSCLALSSSDFMGLYISLELISLSFCLLISTRNYDSFSCEATLKYFVLSSLSSVFYLTGVSFIYMCFGTVNFAQVALISSAGDLPHPWCHLASLGIILVFCSLLFKLGAAPFHTWVADVYGKSEGLISLILAIIPKTVITPILLTMVYSTFLAPSNATAIQNLLGFAGVLSMLSATLGALYQRELKRLFAYSGIVNVGFMCLGLSISTLESKQAVVFFLAFYIVTCYAIWPVLAHIEASSKQYLNPKRTYGSVILQLVNSNPVVGYTLIFMSFSLLGLPPLVGFFGKLYFLEALIGTYSFYGALFTIIVSSLASFYYIRFVKIIAIKKSIGRDWVTIKRFNKKEALIIILAAHLVIFFFVCPSLFYLLAWKIVL